ncbi:MAG: BMP family ABC transporter substrate-binding protein [Micrococcales bacterium]|nr:BMP family ABC transporter substrate-binding protein [Micrococcales bacterium]
MKKMRFAALGAAAALTLGACGSAPSDSDSSGSPAASGSSDFVACMVSDAGGIDDRSFNANAYKGVQDAVAEFGIQEKFLESKSQTDYAPNINSLVNDDCGIIITVGFLMEDATKQAAEENAEEKFAIVDAASDPKIDNMKGLVFNTAQSSFLAGYLAAGMSQTGKVATFGGLPIPSVTAFMDGYWEGVQYYNEQNGTNVEVLGWDMNSPDSGSFAGGFDDQAKGQQLAKNFIQQGADIILPVAGPVGLGAAKEAQSTGKADIIWVDSDGYESAPQYKDVFLTSVLKKIDVAVTDTIGETIEGNFSSEEYVGTLENEGTGLAPFHDFESQVPQELKDQLEQIRQGIIDGTIEVTSPNQPGASAS